MHLPQTLISILERTFKLLDQSIEYLLVSFFLASAGLLLPSEKEAKKESIAYFISAIILGTVSGTVSNNTPYLTDFDYLLACLGTISGPATYALVRRRTLLDLINMYRKAKEGKLEDKDGSKP